jgi:hypothetical protein
MLEYQQKEWELLVDEAESYLKGDCPCVEDEVTVAADKDMRAMREFISYVAKDYIELSHDKVRWQRDDYVNKAKKLLDELN